MRSTFISTAALALAAVAALGTCAHATIIDPQIFFGPAGSTNPPGGTAIGGESNLITSPGNFAVGVAGNHTLNDPLLIIVGVYNGSGAPSISFAGCPNPTACPAATLGTYGITSVSKTLTSGQDAYVALGLTENGSGQASETFDNWAAADVANGFVAPTSFTLDVFALPVGLDAANTPLSIDEAGAAAGSFIIARSCENTAPNAPCSGGDVGATPFTNAGLLDLTTPPPPPPPPPPIDEPSTLALLGAFLGLIWWGRSRKPIDHVVA